MVPELEYDGFVLGESSAIITFLAKEFNLAGKDNREEARCAMIASLASDLLSKGRPVRYEQVRVSQNTHIFENLCSYKFFPLILLSYP